MFSIHYLFLPGTGISTPYLYTGYALCTYACMREYVHSATRAQGTNSFESVIHRHSFECVFRIDI